MFLPDAVEVADAAPGVADVAQGGAGVVRPGWATVPRARSRGRGWARLAGGAAVAATHRARSPGTKDERLRLL